jgi:hypothetical protein
VSRTEARPLPLKYAGPADHWNKGGERLEIADAGKADDRSRNKGRSAIELAASREVITCGRPKCEMAARGVADQNRSCYVQIVLGHFRTKPVDGVANVLEGAWKATTVLVGAPVSNAPDRDPLPCELGTKVAELRTSGRVGSPAAPVDEDRHGMRTGTGGQEDVDGLRRRGTVCQLQSRLRPGESNEGGQFDRIGSIDWNCKNKRYHR